MTLYICCSHLYIPAVLSHYIEKNTLACLYTDKSNIVEMINYLGIAMDVYCSPSFGGLFNFIGHLHEKKSLKDWIKRKNIKDVYFFHEGYCEVANWLMLYLSKLNKSEFHYVPIARSYLWESVEKERGLLSNIRAIYCKWMWGYKPIYPRQDKYCGVLPNSFYEKLCIKGEESIRINSCIGKAILLDGFDENGIVLLNNPNITSTDSEEIYKSFLEDTLMPIMKDCPIYFKNHPGRTKKIGLENDIKEIPSFISGNLLTYRFKIFVGVNSALLCEAANNGAMAICIAYLVDLDESIRESIISYHQFLSDKVFFPKTKEEFLEILKSIE